MNVLQSGKIDYQGQKLAEKLAQGLLFATGIIGFAAGFVLQSLTATLIANAAGFALTLIVCLPPWPMYTKHPITWQPPQKDDDEEEDDDDEGNSKSKSRKQKEERTWLGFLAKLLF